jgi:hypothetical protein
MSPAPTRIADWSFCAEGSGDFAPPRRKPASRTKQRNRIVVGTLLIFFITLWTQLAPSGIRVKLTN